MTAHVIRFGLALGILAASANWVPCFAQEDPARKLAQRNLLKNITKAMIKVELGTNAKTDGRISTDLLTALIAVKLSQSTKLPPPVTVPDNSTGVILAFLETAPSRFNLNVRLICIKFQVLQPESLARSPAATCAEDVTWQTVRFCDEINELVPTTVSTLLALCLNDFVTALGNENPGLLTSQQSPAPTALAVTAPPNKTRDGASSLVKSGWLVIAGRRSGSGAPRALAVVAADSAGTGAE